MWFMQIERHFRWIEQGQASARARAQRRMAAAQRDARNAERMLRPSRLDAAQSSARPERAA